MKMSAKNQREAKDMDLPFLIRYDDGYWLCDFYAANFHVQQSSFYHLAEGTEKNA